MNRTTLVALASGTLALALSAPAVAAPPVPGVRLTPLGSYATGVIDKGGSEIVAWFAPLQRTYVINADKGIVEVLDQRDPRAPRQVGVIDAAGETSADGSVIPAGVSVNSVAIRQDGLGVVAVEAPDKTDRGWMLFFDAYSGTTLGAVRVGSLPDMVTISPDGRYALSANEGEPAEDYSHDPEGTVSVVSLPGLGLRVAPAQGQVRTADFHAFEAPHTPAGLRVTGGLASAGKDPGAYPVSQVIEPEYITVDQQSKYAYVTLQENNAVARIPLGGAFVDTIFPLGEVDHRVVPFDASDKDGKVNITTWPVSTYRMPDGIASYQVKGQTYLVIANEGDTRDWAGFSEEVRVKDLGNAKKGLKALCAGFTFTRDGKTYTAADLQKDENLGRLKISRTDGLRADGSCYESLHGFGGRSFSILDANGRIVFDTRDAFEQYFAATDPAHFNVNHLDNELDGRSDDKGPEPEGVTVGKAYGRTYAFVGLERQSGVMVYDITDPTAARFVTYATNRDYSVNLDKNPELLAQAGDLGPEGLAFVEAGSSPTGRPMLLVGNEVSGTTTAWDVAKILRK